MAICVYIYVLLVVTASGVALGDNDGGCIEIALESWNWNYQDRSLVNYGTVLSMELKKEHYDTPICKMNDTYGYFGSMVWADKGCRGDFKICYTHEDPLTKQIENLNQQLKDLTEKDAKNTAKNAAEIASLKQQDVLNSQMLVNQSVYIQELKTCTSTRVAFMAVLSFTTSQVALPGEKHVIYDKVITNTDGGYDAKTGAFTCITPGVYMFSVRMLVYKGYASLKLQINSIQITSLLMRDDTEFDSGYASAVVLLKRGDIIHVQPDGRYGSAHPLYQNPHTAYQPNVFTGMLLHSDNCVH